MSGDPNVRRSLMIACCASIPLYWILGALDSRVDADLITVGLTILALSLASLVALWLGGRNGLATIGLVIAIGVAVVCCLAIAIEVLGFLIAGEGRSLDGWFLLPWLLGLGLALPTTATIKAASESR